jgi:hypothetical protein
MALGGAQLAAELLLANERPAVDRALQRRYGSLWRGRFSPTIGRAERLGWLLRRPALLQSLVRYAPAPLRLKELLLRASYRTTRLPA